MSAENNTHNNCSEQQNNLNTEPDEVIVQMAVPVPSNPTYLSMPHREMQTHTRTQRQNNVQNSESILEYIPPIYTINGERSNLSQDNVTEQMVIVYQYGKSVKCISIIDMFFGFLHFLITPYGFISFIFPLFGYNGATSYKKYFVDTYLIYQVLYFFINIAILFNILFNENIELPEKQTIEIASFFQTLTILFNLYFIKLTGNFSYNLKSITPEQKTLLLMMNFKNTGGIYL